MKVQPTHPALKSTVYGAHTVHAHRLSRLPVRYRGAIDFKTHKPRTLSELGNHTVLFGTTGSGKSTALSLHLGSVLPPSSPQFSSNYRALIYDAKTDNLPFLGELGFSLEKHLVLTNPFDQRSSAWNIAKDAANPADARAVAHLLLPERNRDENPFFRDSVRSLLAATINGLNREHSEWTFRHLILVFEDSELLEYVLFRTEGGAALFKRLLGDVDPKTKANINATLQTFVDLYRLVAALWSKAKTSFNFSEWSDGGGGLLVIGDHPRYEDDMRIVNNMLVRTAIANVMARPGEVKHDLTWFYLDELKDAGQFPGFTSLLSKGRSKGARAVLAAQGPSSLAAAFGNRDEVEEVLNNCSEKCVMQLGSQEDAEWAERNFTSIRRVRSSASVSDDHRIKDSVTYREEKEAALDARVFRTLRSAEDTGRGLEAFYQWAGAYYDRSFVPGDVVNREFTAMRRGTGSSLPPFVARPPTEYELEPLQVEDRIHLKLPVTPGSSSTVTARSQDEASPVPASAPVSEAKVPTFRLPPFPRP